ncbi:acyl carrier protein [Williamsoniiplasma luminosum]|uniref:Acyl carrier protein n=1 Tax=Williamsoniiplasma luminosum TaxID=214888 RepID=A0A2K8NTD5_9MOLU|nr:phosphopantetheine-binding protein [Williamsoniiplasma luminosum]ATZ17049.1 acyl carrier protein [Williamsoniiplasma luminosum]AVP49715.1 MAG: acyl carrier protein [Williamsoniiplasma luminosum]
MDKIYEQIVKSLKNKGAKGAINKQTRFTDIGVDSLDLMDMVIQLEDELSIRIPDDQLLNIETLDQLLKIIEQLKK